MVPRMSKDELKERLDDPKIEVIDVRVKKDEHKIKGAELEDPHEVGSWAGTYSKQRTMVLYCA